AILCIYGRKFARVVVEGLVDFKNGRGMQSLLAKFVVASIPAALVGFLAQEFIEQYTRTPFVAAYMLALVSILMIIAERLHVDRTNISYPVAIAIGIAQAVALVPGTSRSGATITMGMLLGLRRTEAVDFSFMLSIPIIFGAAAYEMKNFEYQHGNMGIYLWGAFSAFIFGILSLGLLIRYLKKHPLDVFAYYRIALALVILIAAL
ncbi:MAG TPA: undecaprenyl-diphosphate phosphatase, partial [Syntrophorhabdaceae bacterium]|nr:undecaprenyl-diphosphate phosphatase [Syntrophorhabdaceae bacterium]